METAKTHLGNSQLHKNKSVMIEGGQFPRAKVMDQHIIDRYLMLGLLKLQQHQAAEFVLAQAAAGGSWPTGVDWSGTSVTGLIRNYVPSRSFPLGRTLVKVKRRFGWFHMYVLNEIVVHDWDASEDDFRMECFRESLDWIAERIMGRRPDPLRIFKVG